MWVGRQQYWKEPIELLEVENASTIPVRAYRKWHDALVMNCGMP